MDFKAIKALMESMTDFGRKVPAYVYEDDIHEDTYIISFATDNAFRGFDNVFKAAFGGGYVKKIWVSEDQPHFPDIFYTETYYELQKAIEQGDDEAATEIAQEMFVEIILPKIPVYNIPSTEVFEEAQTHTAGHIYDIYDPESQDTYTVEFESGADLQIISELQRAAGEQDAEESKDKPDYVLPAGSLTHLNRKVQTIIEMKYGPEQVNLIWEVMRVIVKTIRRFPNGGSKVVESATVKVDNSQNRYKGTGTIADLAQYSSIFKENDSIDLDVYKVRDFFKSEYRHELSDVEIHGDKVVALFKDGSMLTVECLKQSTDGSLAEENVAVSMGAIQKRIQEANDLVIGGKGEVVGDPERFFDTSEEAASYFAQHPDGVITNEFYYDTESVIFVDKDGNLKFYWAEKDEIHDWDWKEDVQDARNYYVEKNNKKDWDQYCRSFVYHSWDAFRDTTNDGQGFYDFLMGN